MKPATFSQEIKQLVVEEVIPGASWSFINDTEISSHYYGNMGRAKPFSGQPIIAGLYYDLASLTKVIGTTTRILQLIDEGILAFSTKINELIPMYQDICSTIGELLLHCSGLPADFSDKGQINAEALQRYFRHYQTKTGSHKTCYSDIGFILLGEVIQQLDDCSLETSFQKAIFHPLEMKDTSYHVKQFQQAVPTEYSQERGMIQGKVHDSKAYRIAQELGSAGLFSTLADLNRYVQSFLHRDKRLFSQAMFEQLNQVEKGGRTYGWEVKTAVSGERYLFHTGFTGGSIGINQKKKQGAILLTNRVHPNRQDRGFLEKRTVLYNNYF